MLKLALFALPLVACVAEVPLADSDLDSDPELQMIAEDKMPEEPAVDVDTVEPSTLEHALVACSKHRYLHIANFSYVGALNECVNGVCPNGCWGSQRRTAGFACDYDASAPGDVSVRNGGTTFASYNEIKSLNAHDATAVASCKSQSGGAPMRTYTVWNGAGWDSEGIAANVHFAELYGPQNELSPEFWIWYGNSRGSYAPMENFSPQTAISFDEVKRHTARMCSATRDAWLGIYFYYEGQPMSDWKREAIIRGMNYCTTH